MSNLVVRKTILDIWEMKQKSLRVYEAIDEAHKESERLMEEINRFSLYHIDTRNCNGKTVEQNIDQRCWEYLVRLYNLEKYMLCTEYDKMSNHLHDYDFPVFNVDNANAWMDSLKALVYESMQKLIEDVFERITQDTYFTGSSYSNRLKKKRNNNGIDKHFIIRTMDNYCMNYWSGKPTITDDLEKACYIIDGKQLPEITIKNVMNKGKIWESENDYFRIRICQNGNTHYWINEEIRQKLNLYGSKRGIIGENCRIKIFDK